MVDGNGREVAAERVHGETNVAAGQHRPDLHHEGVVIGEVTDLAVVACPRPRYWTRSFGRDDRLGLEQDGRAGDADQCAQRLGDGVHLGLVLAVRPEPLPEERDRVEPDAPRRRRLANRRTSLRRTRSRTSGLAQFMSHWKSLNVVQTQPGELGIPGEVAGSEVGEHLEQGPFVGVRRRPGRGIRGNSRGSARSPARACSRPTRARGPRG